MPESHAPITRNEADLLILLAENGPWEDGSRWFLRSRNETLATLDALVWDGLAQVVPDSSPARYELSAGGCTWLIDEVALRIARHKDTHDARSTIPCVLEGRMARMIERLRRVRDELQPSKAAGGERELDITMEAPGSPEESEQLLGRLMDAIDGASDQNWHTWLTIDGRRIAAIVPVDMAEHGQIRI